MSIRVVRSAAGCGVRSKKEREKQQRGDRLKWKRERELIEKKSEKREIQEKR